MKKRLIEVLLVSIFNLAYADEGNIEVYEAYYVGYLSGNSTAVIDLLSDSCKTTEVYKLKPVLSIKERGKKYLSNFEVLATGKVDNKKDISKIIELVKDSIRLRCYADAETAVLGNDKITLVNLCECPHWGFEFEIELQLARPLFVEMLIYRHKVKCTYSWVSKEYKKRRLARGFTMKRRSANRKAFDFDEWVVDYSLVDVIADFLSNQSLEPTLLADARSVAQL